MTTPSKLGWVEPKQRPNEEWQRGQLYNGVRPPLNPTRAKHHRQNDDQTRVGQKRVRRHPRYWDTYSCTHRGYVSLSMTAVVVRIAADTIEMFRYMHALREDEA